MLTEALRVLCLTLCVLLCACETTQSPPPQVDYALPEVSPGGLGAEDLVNVRVYQEDDLSGDYRVGVDGAIVFPLLGSVAVDGMSPNDLAANLATRLAAGYLVSPHVTVTVAESKSRWVSVIGEVQAPGSYPYRDGMTLVEAVAMASGTTESALLSMVRVTRTTGGEKNYELPYKDITLGRAPDFRLAPSDVILVAESSVK